MEGAAEAVGWGESGQPLFHQRGRKGRVGEEEGKGIGRTVTWDATGAVGCDGGGREEVLRRQHQTGPGKAHRWRLPAEGHADEGSGSGRRRGRDLDLGGGGGRIWTEMFSLSLFGRRGGLRDVGSVRHGRLTSVRIG